MRLQHHNFLGLLAKLARGEYLKEKFKIVVSLSGFDWKTPVHNYTLNTFLLASRKFHSLKGIYTSHSYTYIIVISDIIHNKCQYR